VLSLDNFMQAAKLVAVICLAYYFYIERVFQQ